MKIFKKSKVKMSDCECKVADCFSRSRHSKLDPKVKHDGHFDFSVGGRLHHVHRGHCDDHGSVKQGKG